MNVSAWSRSFVRAIHGHRCASSQAQARRTVRPEQTDAIDSQDGYHNNVQAALDDIVDSHEHEDVESEAHPRWEDMRDALLLELEDKKARAGALLSSPASPFSRSSSAADGAPDTRDSAQDASIDIELEGPVRRTPSYLSKRPIVEPLPQHVMPFESSSEPPLLSRYDWRLSSPLIYRPDPLEPPDLRSARSSSIVSSGYNKLVGVGLPPAREAVRKATKRQKPDEATTMAKKAPLLVESESWGWKVAVPPSERGEEWPELVPYMEKMQRLLQLSADADEALYLEWLKRRGTPEQRQREGITITEASGRWLSDPTSGRSTARMSVWERTDDFPIVQGENCFFELDRPLRFTPLLGESVEQLKQADGMATQGTLVDARDGKLFVAFDNQIELDLDLTYRVDVGNDDASIKLQRKALDNMLFDPTHQRLRNDQHVESAQQSFNNGIVSPLREWTLQGTALRHKLVSSRTMSSDSKDMKITRPLFKDNQLINSWILRHTRDQPMSMPGDPVLGVNASQLKAIARALHDDLSLIQGPPGTGKSATIVALIKLLKHHFRVPEPILLAAPTHVSTDHLLSMLIAAGLSPLRIGKSDRVNADLRQWTIEQRRTVHPLWDSSESARLDAELARIERNKAQDDIKDAKTLVKERRCREAYELADARYRSAVRKSFVLDHRLHASLLATADVFLATTIGAGSNTALRLIDFPVVIIDEAAMCTEPATLLPLMKGAQHVTLIGDHMQLPAVVIDKTVQREKLHVSLFERLMRSGEVKSTLLDTQYRMRPVISGFPNFAFYDSSLHDDTSVSRRPGRLDSAYFGGSEDDPAAFVSHSFAEEHLQQSMLNRGEAALILAIVVDLLERNRSLDASSIGIISPYASQTRLLRELFHEARRPQRPDLRQVEINTVDGFQGREKDVVILSTVRSNRRGHIGFLTDKRRLNVALTRARNALFVVGNAQTLRKARDIVPMSVRALSEDDGARDENADPGVWSLYLDWMEKRGLIRKWDENEAVARQVKESMSK